jgi:hypothetical protein
MGEGQGGAEETGDESAKKKMKPRRKKKVVGCLPMTEKTMLH